jgi:hypothetical protein
MRTPADPLLLNPEREIWLKDNLPVYLIRFYEPVMVLEPVEGSTSLKKIVGVQETPVIEHVYRPSGMYRWKPNTGKVFHYEYTQTRRIELSAVRSQNGEIPPSLGEGSD